jgi:hypothetical protein
VACSSFVDLLQLDSRRTVQIFGIKDFLVNTSIFTESLPQLYSCCAACAPLTLLNKRECVNYWRSGNRRQFCRWAAPAISTLLLRTTISLCFDDLKAASIPTSWEFVLLRLDSLVSRYLQVLVYRLALEVAIILSAGSTRPPRPRVIVFYRVQGIWAALWICDRPFIRWHM